MKQRTIQRVTKLHELFVMDNPDETISLKDFIKSLKHEDYELWLYIKLADTDDWYDFIQVMSKPLGIGFDWSCLPAWGNKYIAMDNNGEWYCYSYSPVMGTLGYSAPFRYPIPTGFCPENFKGSWKESLIKNPNYDTAN